MRLTDEQRKFAEENHDLIYSFMRKLKLDDEWYGAVAIGYVKAVATFDPEKAEFSTYAYTCMNNALKLEYRKPPIPCISLNEIILSENGNVSELQDFVQDQFDYSVDIDPVVDIDAHINKLTARKQKTLLMKAMGFTLEEIAEQIGFSRQRANKIVQDVRHAMSI